MEINKSRKLKKKVLTSESYSLLWSYFYVFITILFTARASLITNSVDFRVNPIGGFLFLFSLICLVVQDLNNNWNKSYDKYLIVLTIILVWEAIHFRIDGGIDYVDLYILVVFHTYSCFLIRRLGFTFFRIAENIIAKLSLFSVIMWFITIVIGPENMAILSFTEPSAPDTAIGSFILFDIPSIENDNGTGMLRNCGFAWEPGLFSCILCIGIAFNLILHRGQFNHNMLFLILGLLSSVSTTGYVTAFVIFTYYYTSSVKNMFKILVLAIFIPIAIYSYTNFEFIGEKIVLNSDEDEYITNDMSHFSYKEDQGETYTPQRFECIQLQALNFIDSPIFGYGHVSNSFVHKRISSMISLSTGILTDFAKFGFILGFLFTLTYCYSFYYICRRAKCPRFLLLIVYLLISFSYSFIMVPFTLCITMFAVYHIPPKKILLYKRMKQKRRRIIVNQTQKLQMSSGNI